MNPFFFGSPDRPLFGVHHSAGGTGSVQGAVLLCYPMGGEYLRAHRAFRQLTGLLVRRGFDVLRFDYSGTGDSWGNGADASVPQWTNDVGAAIAELQEASGVDRVSIVGLRLGATLAALAAFGRDDVDALVLWDPVLAGGEYLDSLGIGADRPGRRAPAGGSPDAGGPSPPSMDADPYPPGTVGIGGFPVTPRLREGVRALDLAGAARSVARLPAANSPAANQAAARAPAANPPAANPPAKNQAAAGPSVDRPAAPPRIRILVSSESTAAERLAGRWREEGLPSRCRCVPSEGDWAEGDRFGSALIPQAIIQAVVDSLVAEDPS